MTGFKDAWQIWVPKKGSRVQKPQAVQIEVKKLANDATATYKSVLSQTSHTESLTGVCDSLISKSLQMVTKLKAFTAACIKLTLNLESI